MSSAQSFVMNLYTENQDHPILVETIRCVQYLTNQFDEWTKARLANWQLVLLTSLIVGSTCRIHAWYTDLNGSLTQVAKRKFFKIIRLVPFVQNKIISEMSKTKESLQEEIISSNKGSLFLQTLPTRGHTEIEILDLIEGPYKKMNESCDYKSGSMSGCVYGDDPKVIALTTKVWEHFAMSNPLHADAFPNIRKMEAEVVRMTTTLFNGDENACGTMTSGGTESIMMACLAYRNIALARGVKKPEILCPVTAHAAFDKAAEFFQMKIRHVTCDRHNGYKVNMSKLRSYITSNTCMLVGSAPQFPHGSIDPIEELSALAVKYNIPLHVDACLGGYLIPFMRDAGYELPVAFDFRAQGVTSISCDTHKYAFTPKGSSVIMYRNKDLRKHQFFAQPDWPGGIYASPTIGGSRPGSLIAMTWATLMYFGHDGYVQTTKSIIETTRFMAKEIRKIKEIRLMCNPEVSVVSFDSIDFNPLKLMDEMSALGWHLNALQNPCGIHIAVTKLHTAPGVAEKFVRDLKTCVKVLMNQDDRKLGKQAAIYCSAQAVPDRSLVSEITQLYLDTCYSTDNKLVSKLCQNK